MKERSFIKDHLCPECGSGTFSVEGSLDDARIYCAKCGSWIANIWISTFLIKSHKDPVEMATCCYCTKRFPLSEAIFEPKDPHDIFQRGFCSQECLEKYNWLKESNIPPEIEAAYQEMLNNDHGILNTR